MSGFKVYVPFLLINQTSWRKLYFPLNIINGRIPIGPFWVILCSIFIFWGERLGLSTTLLNMMARMDLTSFSANRLLRIGPPWNSRQILQLKSLIGQILERRYGNLCTHIAVNIEDKSWTSLSLKSSLIAILWVISG